MLTVNPSTGMMVWDLGNALGSVLGLSGLEVTGLTLPEVGGFFRMRMNPKARPPSVVGCPVEPSLSGV